MRRKAKEVIFLAAIDYDYERQNKGDHLGRARPSDVPIERLEQELRSVIASDLPNDLQRIFGLSVETRVIEIQSGSVLVFFGAAITAVGVFSSYSDFFESIKLVKQHSRLLIGRLMRSRYGGEFDVSVVEQYPSLPDPSERHPWRRLRKVLGPEADEFLELSAWTGGSAPQDVRRDAFFWFLLIFNILLLAAVGVLVRGAVVRTYFP
jgi:hypothetical protein